MGARVFKNKGHERRHAGQHQEVVLLSDAEFFHEINGQDHPEYHGRFKRPYLIIHNKEVINAQQQGAQHGKSEIEKGTQGQEKKQQGQEGKQVRNRPDLGHAHAENFEYTVFQVRDYGVIVFDAPIVGVPFVVEDFAPGVMALVPFVRVDASAEGDVMGDVGPGGIEPQRHAEQQQDYHRSGFKIFSFHIHAPMGLLLRGKSYHKARYFSNTRAV